MLLVDKKFPDYDSSNFRSLYSLEIQLNLDRVSPKRVMQLIQ